jgi:hypothetical protein
MVAVALVVGAGLLPIGPSEAQAADPTVTVDRTGTAPGEELLVTGRGWPKGATVIVELCGQGGIHGSVDCDVTNQRTAGVGPSGTFTTDLVVGTPAVPVPCPCVVKATDQTTRIAATGAISVQGVPTVPITGGDADAVRRIEIDSMEITGGGGWTELFGAPSPRLLELSVVNTGEVTISRPSVAVAWGRGEAPTGFVEVPVLEPMEPGARQDVTVELPRGPLAFGQYSAVAEVQGLPERAESTRSQSTYPWGLLAAGLVLLQVILLRLRNRLRRRVERRRDVPPGADADAARALPLGAVAALPPAVPDDVIDLRSPPDGAPPEGAPEAPASEPAEATLAPAPGGPANGAANGHAANGWASSGLAGGPLRHEAVPTPGATAAADRRRAEAAAAVVAGLAAELAVARDEAQASVIELQQRARVSLQQATALSESLVAAASARAEEALARADAADQAAHDRLAASVELLDHARTQADALLAASRAQAEEILRSADADRDATRALLASVEAERAELVAAARSMIDSMRADLDQRSRAIAESLEDRASTLLAEAVDEQQSRPVYRDELDRRLAKAMAKAVSGS